MYAERPGEATRGRWEVEVTTRVRAKIGSCGLRQEAENTLLVAFLLASGGTRTARNDARGKNF